MVKGARRLYGRLYGVSRYRPPAAYMPTPLLEVDSLTIAFGARTVVDGISFTIAPGQTLGLVGESG